MDILKSYEYRGYQSYFECNGARSLADYQTRVPLYRRRFDKGWKRAKRDKNKEKLGKLLSKSP